MKDCTKEIYLKFDHERMDFHVLQNAVEEVKELPEGVVVECGTGKGIGTRMIIHGLADTNVKFYSVDPYPKYKGGDVNPYSDLDHPLFHDGEFYREAKDRTIETLNGLSKLRNVDFEQVNQDDRYFLLENEEDIRLAFVDSVHTLKHVFSLAVAIIPKVIVGGIVVFDDVQCYDHTKVDQLMYDNNFDVVENTDFKISYRRRP